MTAARVGTMATRHRISGLINFAEPKASNAREQAISLTYE